MKEMDFISIQLSTLRIGSWFQDASMVLASIGSVHRPMELTRDGGSILGSHQSLKSVYPRKPQNHLVDITH